MKFLKDFDVKGKKVLVRCDFNVPLDSSGNITDDFRIKQTLPTIKYLIENSAKIILMSHLGEPKGKADKKLSLVPVAKKLSELLGIEIKMASDCVGGGVKKIVDSLNEKEIVMLENLRFHKEETENNEEFSKQLAELGDIYINDAFGVCHRRHASVVGVARILPSGAGLLLENEVKVLSKVLDNPERPLAVVIGGVKIESKLGMIKEFAKIADNVLIGGKIAETILIVKGICVGREMPDKSVMDEVSKIELTSPKIHLPIDAVISANLAGDVYVKVSAPGKARRDELMLDIGPETINIFSTILSEAKTIVWAGPMGMFENDKFANGTKRIAEVITKNGGAYKIAGGGDTVSAIEKFNLADNFDFVSSGGGAMLAFLGKEKLPGIEALK